VAVTVPPLGMPQKGGGDSADGSGELISPRCSLPPYLVTNFLPGGTGLVLGCIYGYKSKAISNDRSLK
jgi:hypothetical protein